jgi:hypothetical protein
MPRAFERIEDGGWSWVTEIPIFVSSFPFFARRHFAHSFPIYSRHVKETNRVVGLFDVMELIGTVGALQREAVPNSPASIFVARNSKRALITEGPLRMELIGIEPTASRVR